MLRALFFVLNLERMVIFPVIKYGGLTPVILMRFTFYFGNRTFPFQHLVNRITRMIPMIFTV